MKNLGIASPAELRQLPLDIVMGQSRCLRHRGRQ